MAKESMKAREVKRAKLAKKYAAKREALKKIVNTGTPEEAYEAARFTENERVGSFFTTRSKFKVVYIA